MEDALPEAANPRVGVLLPAGNTTVEEEYPFFLRGLATIHFQRFSPLVRSSADLEGFAEAAGDAAAALRRARVAAIGLAYTAGSFWGGAAYDEQLATRIGESSGGVPTITVARAIVDALSILRVKMVAVVSPYDSETNRRCRAFLEESRLEVVSLTGAPPPGPTGDLSHAEVFRMAIASPLRGADGLLLACTALRTLPVIAALERQLSVPVVSSNLALLYSLVRLSGLSGAGRLSIGRLFVGGPMARST